MQESFCEEDISLGYLMAVGAQAGVRVNIERRDDDGVDASIRADVILGGKECASELNVQLKSTFTNYKEYDEYISYKLKAKNYNDMVKDSMTPLCLFLLILPKDLEERVQCTPDELIIKKCMYWYMPDSSEQTENINTVSIQIPKSQRVTPDELKRLLQKVMEER